MLCRRSFLTAAAAGSLAASLARPLAAVPPTSRFRKTIGLQLYTLRNQMSSDPHGTLQTVADLGYHQVELMDVLNGAQEIAEQARDCGLEVTSAFCDWRPFANPQFPGIPTVEELIEAGSDLGLKHMVFGYISKGHRETADDFKRTADRTNAAAEKFKAAGIKLNYHNYSFEFAALPKAPATAATGYEIFIQRFDPQLVKFEIDLFWMALGGQDPLAMLERLGERVAQVHLKDLKAGVKTNFDEDTVPHDTFQALGDGSLDLVAMIRKADQIGVQQCHVEQDQSPEPFLSVARSMRY